MLRKGYQLKWGAVLLIASAVAFGGLAGTSSAAGPPGGLQEATPKHETVFVNLALDGSVETVYVVNTFYPTGQEITDYGRYEEVLNLTDGRRAVVRGERITFPAGGAGGIFRYQGRPVNGQLPWEFAIGYELDGRPIAAGSLPGAGGQLRITVKVSSGPAALARFRDSHLLQVTLPFDLDRATAITAPGATTLIAGDTVSLGFTLLPGEEGTLVAEALVRDFAFAGLQIVAIRAEAVLGGAAEDMKRELDVLGGALGTMTASIAAFSDAALAVNAGAKRLHGGATELESGGRLLVRGVEGAEQALTGLAAGLSQLETASAAMAASMAAIGEQSPALDQAYIQVESALAGMLDDAGGLKTLAAALRRSADPDTRKMAESVLQKLAGLEEVHAAIRSANSALSGYGEGVRQVSQQYRELHKGVEGMAMGARDLARGFAEVTPAAREVLAGTGALAGAARELDGGTAALADGAQALLEGQRRLEEGVDDVRAGIHGHAPGREERPPAPSFVSPRLGRARSVQFLFRVPAQETAAVSPDPSGGEAGEPPKGLWDRFAALFREAARRLGVRHAPGR